METSAAVLKFVGEVVDDDARRLLDVRYRHRVEGVQLDDWINGDGESPSLVYQASVLLC